MGPKTTYFPVFTNGIWFWLITRARSNATRIMLRTRRWRSPCLVRYCSVLLSSGYVGVCIPPTVWAICTVIILCSFFWHLFPLKSHQAYIFILSRPQREPYPIQDMINNVLIVRMLEVSKRALRKADRHVRETIKFGSRFTEVGIKGTHSQQEIQPGPGSRFLIAVQQ